jgi:hypothetical protein
MVSKLSLLKIIQNFHCYYFGLGSIFWKTKKSGIPKQPNGSFAESLNKIWWKKWFSSLMGMQKYLKWFYFGSRLNFGRTLKMQMWIHTYWHYVIIRMVPLTIIIIDPCFATSLLGPHMTARCQNRPCQSFQKYVQYIVSHILALAGSHRGEVINKLLL